MHKRRRPLEFSTVIQIKEPAEWKEGQGEVPTCSLLGFQRLALVGVEEAKGRILGFAAILCLGALP